MKWYNKDKTKMIDIDFIIGYVYTSAKEYIEQNPQDVDIGDFKLNGDKIELFIGMGVLVFRGDTATELFNLMKDDKTATEKELLRG